MKFHSVNDDGEYVDVRAFLDADDDLTLDFHAEANLLYLRRPQVAALRDHLTTVLGDAPVLEPLDERGTQITSDALYGGSVFVAKSVVGGADLFLDVDGFAPGKVHLPADKAVAVADAIYASAGQAPRQFPAATPPSFEFDFADADGDAVELTPGEDTDPPGTVAHITCSDQGVYLTADAVAGLARALVGTTAPQEAAEVECPEVELVSSEAPTAEEFALTTGDHVVVLDDGYDNGVRHYLVVGADAEVLNPDAGWESCALVQGIASGDAGYTAGETLQQFVPRTSLMLAPPATPRFTVGDEVLVVQRADSAHVLDVGGMATVSAVDDEVAGRLSYGVEGPSAFGGAPVAQTVYENELASPADVVAAYVAGLRG